MDLSSWLERRADFAPAGAAVLFEGNSMSWLELWLSTQRVAHALKRRHGIRRGDRIAHLGFNTPALIALIFAAARLGAMLVPLNWRLARPEHAFILNDAAAKLLLHDEDHAAPARVLAQDCPDCPAASLAELAAAEPSGDDANPHVDYDCPLLVVYTSGTTGRPKGAVLTQNAVFWNAVNSTLMHDLTSADRVLTTLPMFHVGAINIQTLPALHAGATVILHRRFDPGATLAAIAAERPTLAVLVPAQLAALQAHPDWPSTDLSSLRMVTTGSSIVPVPLIEGVHARGVPVVQVYGSTETAPIAIYLRPEDARRKIGSCGKPAVHCDIRVVNDRGKEVAAELRGEILVRGPNVMFEYWGNAGATAEALREGWFHTGDIGHRDAEGFFYIDERKTDVIISGGENIYPAEVELILAEIPEIAEAAVVARQDARWGEVPVAVVVPRPGASLDERAILSRFDGRLARFKHPRAILVADALPKSALGKVLKYQVRAWVAERDAHARTMAGCEEA